ncbi:MAG: Fe-S cluster assembly protein SufD [Prevotella sp.]|nr:Fe-S cluster assembly protein SufD [Prevotella sp.]
MKSEQQFIDIYNEAREVIYNNSCREMNAVRDKAFEDFCRLGFPSRKVERYKYTNMQELFAPDYGLNLKRLQFPVNPYDVFRCDVPNLSTQLFFMVNDGFYQIPPHVSPQGGKQSVQGVQVCSLSSLTSNSSPLTSHLYGRLAKTEEDGVTALNTMLAQDGLLVYVPKNVKVDKAIQVINMLTLPQAAPDTSLMVNRRVLIVVEEGAEVKLLFCDHAADDHHFLTTQVIEAYVGENASLDLYCLEETHLKNVRVSNVYVEQQANSRLKHNVITLHNGITRNMLNLTFKGEGAECECNGCAISDKQQHVDNNTLIDHQAAHCTSRELYKYVLNDQSTGAFAGRVLVRPDAQQTSSEMRNQNLCATKQTRMYTQPMLEIYADDVKCSHGSTVGQLNEAALFYMRQRGITEKEARQLLQQAFVGEVIDGIQLEALRDRLRYLVEKRFRGELNKCEGCKLCH